MTWCCDSDEGDTMVVAGSFWSHAHRQSSRSVLMTPQYRWMREHRHAPHSRRPRRRTISRMLGVSAGTGAPSWPFRFVSRENSLESLTARRTEVRPFTAGADQAARNLRRPSGHRHRERAAVPRSSTESLEQQTATSEILGVIASSPTDIQPVLDVVAENAARLCDATDAVIHRIDGDKLRSVANYGPLPGRRSRELIPIDRDSYTRPSHN